MNWNNSVICSIVFLSLYIGYLYGASSGMVGTTTKSNVVEWYFPYELVVFVLIPAILGYFIGKGVEDMP